jgi:hypothetical protein
MKRFFFVFVCLILAAATANAQDVLYKRNGQTVDVKVIELGISEVKYRNFNEPDGPVYVVEKESIQKIVFKDGHTEFYGEARMDATEAFAGQKKSALKISFLGPLSGSTTVVYERSIRPGRNWESKAVLVGLGRQLDDNPVGFIASGAYKFYSKPTYYTADMKRSHLLQGAYIKPEVFLGYTTFDEYGFDPYNEERVSSMTGGLLLNLGKQWIFGGDFVLDLAFGFGYGAGRSNRSIYVVEDTGFAFSGTLNIGWTLK